MQYSDVHELMVKYTGRNSTNAQVKLVFSSVNNRRLDFQSQNKF